MNRIGLVPSLALKGRTFNSPGLETPGWQADILQAPRAGRNFSGRPALRGLIGSGSPIPGVSTPGCSKAAPPGRGGDKPLPYVESIKVALKEHWANHGNPERRSFSPIPRAHRTRGRGASRRCVPAAERLEWAPQGRVAFTFGGLVAPPRPAMERWMCGGDRRGAGPARYPGHGRALADGPVATLCRTTTALHARVARAVRRARRRRRSTAAR